MTFDRTGRCLRVPGQRVVPPDARVRAYPVAENLGVVWVWPGDPARADRSKLFDLPQCHNPRWTTTHGDSLQIGASYLSVCDNLIDPSHVSFVHLSTIGSSASEDVPVRSEERGNTVVAWRWILDAPPVPVIAKLGRFKGNVDRWHYYYLHAPSVALIDFGSSEPGAIGPEGDRGQGMQLFSCHFITPVDERNTVDHWMHVRNFAPADETMSDFIRDQFRIAFAEDKVILEAIQREEDLRGPSARRVKLALDASAVRLHRVIERLIADEAAR
jgi:vanillate O-demethylase monooxygenase subunit